MSDPVVSPADTSAYKRLAAMLAEGEGLDDAQPMYSPLGELRAFKAEMDALLAVGERDKAERDFYKRQLDAVDANLRPWESESPDGCAVGRVQTILNLKADRKRGERYRQRIARLTEALETLLSFARPVDIEAALVQGGVDVRSVLADEEDAANG